MSDAMLGDRAVICLLHQKTRPVDVVHHRYSFREISPPSRTRATLTRRRSITVSRCAVDAGSSLRHPHASTASRPSRVPNMKNGERCGMLQAGSVQPHILNLDTDVVFDIAVRDGPDVDAIRQCTQAASTAARRCGAIARHVACACRAGSLIGDDRVDSATSSRTLRALVGRPSCRWGIGVAGDGCRRLGDALIVNSQGRGVMDRAFCTKNAAVCSTCNVLDVLQTRGSESSRRQGIWTRHGPINGCLRLARRRPEGSRHRRGFTASRHYPVSNIRNGERCGMLQHAA